VFFKHANQVLKENVRMLMEKRQISQKDLALYCGHGTSWANKWLNGTREIQFKDLDRMADLFGILPHQLFTPGISPMTERRVGAERRKIADRRQTMTSRLGLPEPPRDVALEAQALAKDLYDTIAKHTKISRKGTR
jgi:transcriptional regulator with XRE-family HTH domain